MKEVERSGANRAMATRRPEIVRIYTDSPIDSMWTYYRRLEAVEATRRMFGDRLSAENATAIRDCVRQAREYFASARSAPLLTKPVLLYYGMVSLGKVLFLLSESPLYDMDSIEAFERQGHGLKHFDPATGSPSEIEAGEIEVTADKKNAKSPATPRGVFARLAELVNRSPVDGWYSQRITLMEVLRSIPQLDTVLKQVLGNSKGYAGLFVDTSSQSDGSLKIIVDPEEEAVDGPEGAQARVPYLDPEEYQFATLRDGVYRGIKDPIAIHLPVESVDYSLLAREEFSRGTMTLPPAWRGHRLDSILSSYLLMYALSIIARYKPHRWSRILEGKDSVLLPVIETQMMVSERWWPNLMLNRLTDSWVLFSPPSYW